MVFKNLLKRSSILILSLSLVGCGGNTSNKSTPSVTTESADVVVSNAAEIDDVKENNSESHIMAPRAKQIYHFAFDSSALNEQIRNALKEQAAYLKNHPKTKVILAGHADIRGTHEYNMELGSRRAESIASYLYGQGVGYAQIEKISYGKEKPIAAGNTEKAHSENRRVELTYQSTFSL